MIFKRLTIDGFASLAGEWRFDPERLNLIIGENERGKTTLAAAIVAALYGLDGDKRSYRDRETPLEQHRPWSGRSYALELEFDLGDKRYVVSRNFSTGRLVVLENGKDTTESFRHGSGEYKLGEELLGMSAEQFARSALWLQPGPGRLGGPEVRPDGSLTTLLEGMATSVPGDTTAVAALEALDSALRSYKGFQQSGMVANEIKKIENALGANRVELTSAESDRREVADGVARLSELSEKEERLAGSLASIRRTDTERRIADLNSRLAQDRAEQDQLAALRAEAKELAPMRDFQNDAAERLRNARAEAEAARASLERLTQDREREVTKPRRDLDTKRAPFRAYEWASTGHIEELHTLEKDLERSSDQEKSAAGKLLELEKELAGRGVSLAYLSERASRFGGLTGDDRTLLTQYPAQTQAIVVESENSQRAISGGQALVDEIGRQRGRLRALGFAVGAIGLFAGAIAVWLALGARSLESFLGLGITLAGLGAAGFLLLRSASHRNAARAEALHEVVEAQRRYGELRQRRNEREELLVGLATRLGFPDVTALLREHGEFLRLTSESQRMGWLEEDATRARTGRSDTRNQVHAWAKRAGLPDDLPAHEALARLRQGIGSVLDLRAQATQIDALETRLGVEEKEIGERLEATRADIASMAARLGVPDPEASDEAIAAAVEKRAEKHRRLTQLEFELIPAAENRVMPVPDRTALEAEAETLRSQLPTGETGGRKKDAAERASKDAAALEADLETVRRERLDLIARVGGRDRDAAERTARLLAERTRLEAALERAVQFRAAVELARERFQAVARETHARWSEQLGGRVETLLRRFGLSHQGFRISDRLDISLALAGERLAGSKLEASLSAGARDQLTLALRVAICEYLSRGASGLPLLLDDPLATSDDERAARLLRTLVEVSRSGHQVIVMSCHRARLANLRAADPLWFEAAIKPLDLGAGSASHAS